MDVMKSAIAVLFALTIALWGQSESRTYVFDSEGRRVPWTSSSSSNGVTGASVETLNGRKAPLENVEERLISQQDGVKTVERLIRRVAPDGTKLPPEREVIETTDLGGGRQTVTKTVYRGDFNGRMAQAERVVEQTAPAGTSGATVTTLIDRPSINGSFQTVEKREARITTGENRSERDETSYLPDANGRFAEASRVVERMSKSGGKTLKQVDEFETALTGRMTLSKQVVSTTTETAGGEVTVSDVYGTAAAGRPETGQLQIRERRVVEKAIGAGGVTETLSVQRPAVDGSGQLGELRKISETVCTGKCAPPKP